MCIGIKLACKQHTDQAHTDVFHWQQAGMNTVTKQWFMARSAQLLGSSPLTCVHHAYQSDR